MTHAFHSDAAEKIRAEVTPGERAVFEAVRRALEDGPW